MPSRPTDNAPQPTASTHEERAATARRAATNDGTATAAAQRQAQPAPAREARPHGGRAQQGRRDHASAGPFPFRLDFPPELPVSARAEEIVEAIQRHPVLILAGETGSGKTTQLPKLCLAAGRGELGRIACTQPRRVAALSVSRRVAEELGVAWGREVGCKVRFNDQTSRATRIKFLTDGMLLAEVQGDPLLREYDTVIIDEAHERSLNIDFLIGHLRTLRARRPELKIILTSATIDTALFSEAFDNAPVISVSGRSYPVEIVYSPLDALGRDYSEDDENADPSDQAAIRANRAEALHYIDSAVQAVEQLLAQSRTAGGDLLVFMPSERDIREACDLLAGPARSARAELIPLFGRLSASEQQRVFAPSQARKIIVATNIAETSLTLPGIRFVIDTGLARVSRYSPQTRTRRLPIEAIAQSSADQRAGRSGRVAEGLCVRLYSEADYAERPRFTQPEIQRANLADVILRMLASGLGDIESFPFINRPAAKAVSAGYALLEELGALDKRNEAGARQLTPLGRELARLPVDPTIGRMILQARRERCLREVLIIAAALSIQDPRERPLDKQAQADTAHRRWLHPDSDFLTLLKLWEAYHDQLENLSQARLRKFCREHFLSYPRMREWRDIHAQLSEAVTGLEGPPGRATGTQAKGKLAHHKSGKQGVAAREQARAETAAAATAQPPKGPTASAPFGEKELRWGMPAYRAVHRAILAGLLSNIAEWHSEGRYYKAQRERRLALFPGSVLFTRERDLRKATPPGAAGAASANKASAKRGKKKGAAAWIVAGEVVETSRLYARTCARIDPQWAAELGAHLVKRSYSEPFWDAEKGRVMVKQRTRLYGLELDLRAVSYGRIDPRAATELFIREGLVNDTITWPLDCLAHNRAVRAEIENQLTRRRDSSYLNLDEALYRFYAAQLHEAQPPHYVSAVGELVTLLREQAAGAPGAGGAEGETKGRPDFLKLHAEQLLGPEVDAAAHAAHAEDFPESLPLQNSVLALNYAYQPGEHEDGVTLDVAPGEVSALSEATLDWAVPGHLAEKVEFYLRALPKELRRALVPLGETAKSLAGQLASRDRLTGRREMLCEALAAQLNERFGLHLSPAIWAGRALPEHLRVRVRVVDAAGRELCASRELTEIRAALASMQVELAAEGESRAVAQMWERARTRWEQLEQDSWSFGDIARELKIGARDGLPLLAYPGLRVASDGVRVSLKLFRDKGAARAATWAGLRALLALQLRHDLLWLARDLRDLRSLGPLIATLAPLNSLEEDAAQMLTHWACDPARCGMGCEPARIDGNEAASQWLLRAADFESALAGAKRDLRGIVPRLVDLLREVLNLRQELLVCAHPYPGLAQDLARLLPPDFMRAVSWPQLAQFPRYLRAMRLRVERARQNPGRDAERARLLAPYLRALAGLEHEQADGATGAARRAFVAGAGSGGASDSLTRLRWLIEEFRVSLFAQELGTAEPVSAKKIDGMIDELRRAQSVAPGTDSASSKPPPSGPKPAASAAPPPAAPKPAVAAPAITRQIKPPAQPLKSLSALDKLFAR